MPLRTFFQPSSFITSTSPSIAEKVICTDLQRYLGPDALVLKSSIHKGQHGYWYCAWRPLTDWMVERLKEDTRRWEEERGNGVVSGKF